VSEKVGRPAASTESVLVTRIDVYRRVDSGPAEQTERVYVRTRISPGGGEIPEPELLLTFPNRPSAALTIRFQKSRGWLTILLGTSLEPFL
jgi:hypothetical protein